MNGPPILTLLLAMAAAPAPAAPCDNGMIRVETERTGLHDRICSVAEAALRRLAACHLPQEAAVTIELRERIESQGGICLGAYHCGEDRIELLFPEAFSIAHAGSDQFGSIPAEAHFDSIIVHELTHALLDRVPCPSGNCVADQEYIAYSMQLGSLSAPLRETFLAETGARPSANPDRINDFLLALAPGLFAAYAWYHFSAPGNGCEMVGRIVEGEFSFRRMEN